MLKYNFYTNGDFCHCEIFYKTLKFTGTAKCHHDDIDMKSDRTGYFIAEARANIEKLRWCREYEVIPMVKYLRHQYNCVSHSPKYNPNSYEAAVLKRELNKWEKELKDIREAIKEEREYLTHYINEKEKLYQRWRKDKNN